MYSADTFDEDDCGTFQPQNLNIKRELIFTYTCEYNIYRPTLNRKAIRHGGTQVPGPLHKTCKFKFFKRILKTKVLQQTRSGWKEKTIFIDSIVD